MFIVADLVSLSKSCNRSWLAHKGTIYAYTKPILGKIAPVLIALKSCVRSWSSHKGTIYAYTKAILCIYKNILWKNVYVLITVILSKKFILH